MDKAEVHKVDMKLSKHNNLIIILIFARLGYGVE
jgi:hypothetical protein